MVVHNANNRDDMSQISYNNFGNITNRLTKVLEKVADKEVSVVGDD